MREPPALHELYADVRKRLGTDAPIEIRTVRLTTDGEIKLSTWHRQVVAREQQTMQP